MKVNSNAQDNNNNNDDCKNMNRVGLKNNSKYEFFSDWLQNYYVLLFESLNTGMPFLIYN